MNLIELFDSIVPPAEGDPFQFSAFPISFFENHRIAKDKFSNPSLLIFISLSETKINPPNLNLKNVKVFFENNYTINQSGNLIEKTFTSINYIGEDLRLKEYFLDLCFIFVKNIGNNPSRENVRIEINRMVELFRLATLPPIKNVQGLWAELFLINESINPVKLLKCWHYSPQEKFDFNDGEERIEVKSTSSTERIHTFSLEQLNPPAYTTVIIASIFVKQSSTGKTINNLYEEILCKITDKNDLIEKLKFQISLTLGKLILSVFNLRFDVFLAKESISFYKVKDIPSISVNQIPASVTEVRFKSDLRYSKKMSKEEIRSSGELFRSLT